MDEERFDVALVGVDPTRPRAEVITGLARRLVKSAEEVEELIARAPSPVLRSVAASDVPGLLDELRDLGARVKRQRALPLVPTEARGPDATTIELLGASRADEASAIEPAAVAEHASPASMAPAPIESVAPIASMAEPALPTDPLPPSDTAEGPPSPPPALAPRPDAAWLVPKSLPEGTFSKEPARKVAPAPLAERAPSAARRGRAERLSSVEPAAHFFEALPRALRAPFGRALALPSALAPLLGALAIALVALGLRSGEPLGPLGVALGATAAAGFLGLVLQLASSAMSATASARPPQPLPARLLPDYLGPGARLLVGEGALVWLAFAARDGLATHALAPLATPVLACSVFLYATLTFALVVANGTTLSLLDVAHAWTLLWRGGLRTLVLLALGGLPLVLGAIGAITVVDMASHARTMRVVVADLAILGPAAAAASTLGASITGSLVALLVRARE